jgi:hypothetical protein
MVTSVVENAMARPGRAFIDPPAALALTLC